MTKSLTDIANDICTSKLVPVTVPTGTREIEEERPVPKVQLIYAFNGAGKTRLSKKVKELFPSQDRSCDEEESDSLSSKVLYYNAFTEDLFYWDNDLTEDTNPKLKIQPNSFTPWILADEGKENQIKDNFQRYTNEKLTPIFNQEYDKEVIDKDGQSRTVKTKAFSEVTFSYQRGNLEPESDIKISKGEESNFIWSIFYSILEQIIETRNITDDTVGAEVDNKFDNLEYIFIDDPVSSLDENHLIDLAVDIAKLIKSSESDIKFIITTHNPLFFNILYNEFNKAKKYLLRKLEDGSHKLEVQQDDSPFAYHLFLLSELKEATISGDIRKYHFNFLRNVLEKTATFLGYDRWSELLSPIEGDKTAYQKRILDLGSHSKFSSEEMREPNDDDKLVFKNLVDNISNYYRFKL